MEQRKKVHPRFMGKARKLIFNRESLSGGDFTRRMNGLNYFTYRSNFFERGVYPEDAEKAAGILDQWAAECNEAAEQLRAAAARASSGDE